MNNVTLIGRLTRDVDLRFTGGPEQKAVARFSVAIDRGNDRGADYPSIVVFGKQAENCGRYLKKGRMVAIQGRIQTGSYEKDGRKIYTTDVIADRVKFLEWESAEKPRPTMPDNLHEYYADEDDEIPF